MKSSLRRHQTAQAAHRAEPSRSLIDWLLAIHNPNTRVASVPQAGGSTRAEIHRLAGASAARAQEPLSELVTTGNFTQPGIDIPNLCSGKIPEIAVWGTGFGDSGF